MGELRAGRVKPVPSQVGPVHFETLGKLISVRCPREYAGMMRQHGGEWDPGARRWLIDRRRLRRGVAGGVVSWLPADHLLSVREGPHTVRDPRDISAARHADPRPHRPDAPRWLRR